MDTADEAGGEAIYSSDGLPPLITRAPKLTSIALGDAENVLDSENLVDPAAAVSLFMSTPKETTQEKLARLQREVSELEKEAKNDSSDVATLACELAAKLVTGVNERDDLTRLLDKHMKREKAEKISEESGVIYELYGGTVASSSTTEERLLKLEQVIGGSASAPLMSRLQDLEKKMKFLDEKSLEDAVTKAKVIRSDLEAASKARSKLSTSSSSADNKTISELHSQLIQLEGISEHLPALTHRLQQLAHLHVSAANFSSRLTQAEESITTIQGSLASLEASMGKIEESMVQNIKTMDSNLKQLEANLG